MLRACGNREDAEDVLIEALLKAYQHMQQLNDPDAFRAWLAFPPFGSAGTPRELAFPRRSVCVNRKIELFP